MVPKQADRGIVAFFGLEKTGRADMNLVLFDASFRLI